MVPQLGHSTWSLKLVPQVGTSSLYLNIILEPCPSYWSLKQYLSPPLSRGFNMVPQLGHSSLYLKLVPQVCTSSWYLKFVPQCYPKTLSILLVSQPIPHPPLSLLSYTWSLKLVPQVGTSS